MNIKQVVQSIRAYNKAASDWSTAQNAYVASFQYGRSLKSKEAVEKYTPTWEAAQRLRDKNSAVYNQNIEKMRRQPRIVRLIANLYTHREWKW